MRKMTGNRVLALSLSSALIVGILSNPMSTYAVVDEAYPWEEETSYEGKELSAEASTQASSEDAGGTAAAEAASDATVTDNTAAEDASAEAAVTEDTAADDAAIDDAAIDSAKEDAADDQVEEAAAEETPVEEAVEVSSEENLTESAAEASSEDETEAGDEDSVPEPTWEKIIVTADGVVVTWIRAGNKSSDYGSGNTLKCPQDYATQILVYAQPNDSEDIRVLWSTSDSSIATIDETGFLRTYKKAGTTVITMTAVANPDITATFNVEVSDKSAAKDYWTAKVFKPTKNVLSVDVGQTTSLGMIADSTAAKLGKVRWSSASGLELAAYNSAFDSNGKTPEIILTARSVRQGTVSAYLEPRSKNDLLFRSTVRIAAYVNGYDQSSLEAFKDGKRLSGWLNVESASPVAYEYCYRIKSAGKIAVDDTKTIYIDPFTCKAVRGGAYKIGKKIYLFDTNSFLLKGTVQNNKTLYNGKYCLNTDGELCTGWQKTVDASGSPSANEFYFDPVSCIIAKNKWVPKGKGRTYVDSEGIPVGNEDQILTIKDTDNVERLYCFKGGNLQTGFVYESAARAYYFDPAKGGAAATGLFTVKNKKYLAGADGSIGLDRKFSQVFGGVTRYYYADKTGAIVENGFINGSDGKEYYAGADGVLYKNVRIMIGGRLCSFDADCALITYASGTESDFYYWDDDTPKKAYIKSVSADKPSGGVAFYTEEQCQHLLKNCWLTDADGNPKAYADKNGKTSSGIQKIAQKSYYFNENGMLPDTEGIVTSGKKLFYHDANGQIAVTPGFIPAMGGFAYVKDKSGTLAEGMVTIDKKKYCFSGGLLVYSTDAKYRKISFDGKTYVTNTGTAPTSAGEALQCYIPMGKLYYIEDMVIGKDGSPYQGILVLGDTQYFLKDGKMQSNIAVVTGGKLYCFGNDGKAVKGWYTYSGRTISLDDSSVFTPEEGQSFYFYFDTKKYFAYTGWKTMFAPERDENGEIVTDANNNPVSSTVKKKLYFNEVTAGDTPKGALIYSKDSGFGRTEKTVSGSNTHYYYSTKDGKLECNVVRKTGKKWYYYGSNGQVSCSFWGQITNIPIDVVARYNSDKSIKGFYNEETEEKINLKNAFVRCNTGSYVIIGKNGLPVTGIIDVPEYFRGYCEGQKVFVEEDGRLDYVDLDGKTGKYSLIKYKGKYYITDTGVVPYATEDEIPISDYSSLPASDRNELDKLKALAESAGKELTVVMQKDGTVKAGSFLRGGKTVHTNKFGVVTDNLSDFYKQGGSWHTALLDNPAVAKSTVIELSPMDGAETIKAMITVDDKGKIRSFTKVAVDPDFKTEIDSGELLTGIYRLNSGSYICLKKGKIATGKQKYTLDGYTASMYFDPISAIGRKGDL